MDLSTIREKLDSGIYIEPWQFIEDVWLMLDNARRYNRKGSNVYRGAELVKCLRFILQILTTDYQVNCNMQTSN